MARASSSGALHRCEVSQQHTGPQRGCWGPVLQPSRGNEDPRGSPVPGILPGASGIVSSCFFPFICRVTSIYPFLPCKDHVCTNYPETRPTFSAPQRVQLSSSPQFAERPLSDSRAVWGPHPSRQPLLCSPSPRQHGVRGGPSFYTRSAHGGMETVPCRGRSLGCRHISSRLVLRRSDLQNTGSLSGWNIRSIEYFCGSDPDPTSPVPLD